MDNKFLRCSLIALVAFVLVVGSFSGGFVLGVFMPSGLIAGPEETPATVPTPLPPSTGGTPEDLQTLFGPFWEAWQLVHEYYVDRPLDDTKLVQGAIRGMMEALGDPNTLYMNPQENSDWNISMTGVYQGIGAWVDTSGEYLTIISPMPGSPAEQAGLRPGDQIIAIDGEDMTGVGPELARLKVLGQAGTTVHLTVRRKGVEEPLEFYITRAEIMIPSAEGKMLEDGVAYVRLFTFDEKANSELRQILPDLMAQNPRGLILDLRNNGGGYLDQAVWVASEFISEGVILYEQYGDGSREVYEARPGGLATEIPLVVLVNENTASASELVAGAIQDHERGLLVGVTTFGKGTVQTHIGLSDGGAAHLTVARWLTPNGNTINNIGLTPDVVVEMTEEDYAAGLDPQLDKAIKVLLEMIGAGSE